MTSTKVMIGNDAFGTLAVYNINNTATKSKTAKFEPTTCRSYAHELYITRFGTDMLALQSSVGSPILRVNCSYTNNRLPLFRVTR